MTLEGRVAFITGAASGIGRASAILLAEHGATIVATDVNDKGLTETLDLLPKESKGEKILLDVSDSKAVDAAVAGVEERHGRLDIMANVAGIPFASAEDKRKVFEEMSLIVESLRERRPPSRPPEFLHHLTDADFKRMLRVNLYGTFYCMRAAIPIMTRQGKGAIVNCSSAAAFRGPLSNAHYTTSKAAIIALTRNAATELGPRGIRVNAIAPGAIDTPMVRDGLMPEFLNMLMQHTPLQRLADPREAAEAILFLASDASSYFTGQTLEPNGGIHSGL